MPNLNITPQTVLLSPGSAITFNATNAAGAPVPVNWSVNPVVGTLVVPPAAANAAAPPPSSSATFIAPPTVAAAQTVALLATTGADFASAAISLTPDVIAVVPAQADLKAGQSQQFLALVGAPPDAADPVQWFLNPQVGTLDQAGLYTAPDDIPDSFTLTISAARRGLGKEASAKVNLTAPPWKGAGVDVLGAYLLLVFCVVFGMIRLWPPTALTPADAETNVLKAQSALDTKTKALQAAATAVASIPAAPANTAPTPSAQAASTVYLQAQKAEQAAESDLDKARADQTDANNPCVTIKVWGRDWRIAREVDILLLVLLAGALGSFLHATQSFSAFVGNRTIKKSWSWWYTVNPFIGAGLAFVFYAALRGGVMTATTATSVKSTDLNTFGVVAIGCIVGMFAKDATQKLGDVFKTLFQSNTPQGDKLTSSSPAGQAGSTPTGTAPGAGATKP